MADELIRPDFSSIPEYFRSLRQWVGWRHERDPKGRLTKVPYSPNGRKASSTDPSTWSSLDQVQLGYDRAKFTGVGFVIAGNLRFYDFDGVLDENGDWLPWEWDYPLTPRQVFEQLIAAGGWYEISPSGRGLHVFVLSEAEDEPSWQRDHPEREHSGIAYYTHGRYAAMTFRQLERYAPGPMSEITLFTQDLAQTFSRNGDTPRSQSTGEHGRIANGTKPECQPAADTAAPPPTASSSAAAPALAPIPIDRPFRPLSDEEILAFTRTDSDFAAYWNHERGIEDHSDSGIELALAQKLAFYSRKDPVQIDRIIRSWQHFRADKWDRPTQNGASTYGADTIAHAISLTSNVWEKRGRGRPPKNVNTAAAPPVPPSPPPPPEPGMENAPNLLPLVHTDIGNATRIKLLYGDRLHYSAEEKGWYVSTGTHWSRNDGEAQELAKKTAREFLRQAHARGLDRAQRFALDSGNYPRIARALKLLQSELTVPLSRFDSQPHLLNCQNGTVDLRTGELRPHRREDYLTKLICCDYVPGAKCPQFRVFLADILGWKQAADAAALAAAEEKLSYLQLALGYSITGESSEKTVFLAHGKEDTGKTTLLGLVREILGDYAISITLEVVMSNDRSNSADAVRADLRGVRFAQSSETEEGQRMSTAMLKRLCQGPGGEINACRKYEHPIRFEETHKLWIDANHRPKLSATDSAAWRRLRLIPFDIQIAPDQQDKGLHDRLLREEREGILAWLVAGAQRWYASGLGQSEIVRNATEQWRKDVNHVQLFLDQNTVKDEEPPENEKDQKFVLKATLAPLYKAWCEENNERPLGKNQLSAQMKALGYQDGKKEPGMAWLNLQLERNDD